ncbi:hypothetical protein B0A53_04018 [Rhodotorula sp. CCFEE 5036]|nr:hypothetical protein B0A53_04018 [Rhodotorula sp. CCFEE 5036]
MVAQKLPNNSLTIIDNRTGKSIDVKVEANAIPATAFKKLTKRAGDGDREEDECEAGIRVYDPGFVNTATVRSSITFIDGTKGVLRHRGYPIEQLAEKSNFLETAYLLLYGELPSRDQFQLFEREVMHHTFVHRDLEEIIGAFRHDAHPMSILTSAFAALGAYAPEANPSLAGQKIYTSNTAAALQLMDKQIFRLIGKSITLAAMAYRVRQSRQFVSPPQGMTYSETFLYMMDHLNEPNYKPHPVIAKALDTLFLLHADHEMNASCAAVLQVGSTLVDPYSAVSAGCAALYGPSHGGANEAVIRMLISIGSPDKVPEFLERLPTMFFALTGRDPLLDTALALRDAALADDYFISRRLAPNVDFFSGLIYRAIGFPLDYFPVLFAVPRVVGWLAHWRQMMLSGSVKIWRPRQVYIGAGAREYEPMEERKAKGNDAPSPVSHPTSTRVFLARESKL